jgi:hypothetical protein
MLTDMPLNGRFQTFFHHLERAGEARRGEAGGHASMVF